ncbi:MAG: nucleotidyltransferase family protein [Syntrophus sp. SKADARSKE-3]|nr:nucleotidyltransferase family protein [Syntrophus sp. SKADARSKE-3]
MQAVILAGGRGKRLRPYTTVLPKPLMPIGDYPILEVVIRQLKKNGFNRIILAIGHQHQLFTAFFGNGEKWGIHIDYYVEEKPLGTAGPLRGISSLDDHFLMMNGDILTDLNFAKFMEFHRSKDSLLTIATHERTQNIDYGTLEFNSDGFLELFSEKPVLCFNVSMGIYALTKKAVDFIPDKAHFDFPELVCKLRDHAAPVACYPYGGYWMDIGRPDDYEIAIDDFDKMKDQLL